MDEQTLRALSIGKGQMFENKESKAAPSPSPSPEALKTGYSPRSMPTDRSPTHFSDSQDPKLREQANSSDPEAAAKAAKAIHGE